MGWRGREKSRPASRLVGIARLSHNGKVTKGEQLLEEFRRQRRRGDPRLTDGDKQILRRITTGDLADEFADSLAAISEADQVLGGGPGDADD